MPPLLSAAGFARAPPGLLRARPSAPDLSAPVPADSALCPPRFSQRPLYQRPLNQSQSPLTKSSARVPSALTVVGPRRLSAPPPSTSLAPHSPPRDPVARSAAGHPRSDLRRQRRRRCGAPLRCSGGGPSAPGGSSARAPAGDPSAVAPPARGRAGPGAGAGRERPGAPAPWRRVGPLAAEAACSERLLCAQLRLFLTTTAGRRPRMVPFYREGPRAKLRKMPRSRQGRARVWGSGARPLPPGQCVSPFAQWSARFYAPCKLFFFNNIFTKST